MRIDGWECHASPDGRTRAASHKDDGSVAWVDGRFIAHCDAPKRVVEWLIRPTLSAAWVMGALGTENPFAEEPPNKDKDPS
jgi:hypothetical protein